MPEVPTLSARQPRAVHSALTVLEAVAHLGAGVTARELSLELGLPRATTYRLVNLLVQDEYLVRTPDLTGFALGAKVARLAGIAAPPPRLSTAARDLVTQTRVTVRGGIHLVQFIGGRAVLVDSDPDFPFSDPVRLGREPQHYALGKLLVLESDGAMAAREIVADVERFGAARHLEGAFAGYGCLAVPIRDDREELAGALAFSGPRHRIDDPTSLLAVLKPAANRLAPLIT